MTDDTPPTPGRARYTEQLVLLEEPDIADRVRALAIEHRLSQAEILRAVVRAGLPAAAIQLEQAARRRAELLGQ